MNCYKIKDVNSDGYVTLVTTDNNYESQIPLRSTKIMFESGSLLLANPEKIYDNCSK